MASSRSQIGRLDLPCIKLLLEKSSSLTRISKGMNSMNHARHLLASSLIAFIPLTNWLCADEPIKYPESPKVDHVDEYHGTKVADPYRWLEDDVRTSQKVADWVESQNKVTFEFLESIPERTTIQNRLTELWNYEKYSAPFKRGGRYYYLYNSGLQNQYVLYTMDSLDGEPRVLIDPNEWSKDGTVAMAGTSFSDDGKYVAYGVQDAGSDWRSWQIMEIESGKLLDDKLKWLKFSGISWTKDEKGFFYGRYDAPDEGTIPKSESQSEDLLSPRRHTAR